TREGVSAGNKQRLEGWRDSHSYWPRSGARVWSLVDLRYPENGRVGRLELLVVFRGLAPYKSCGMGVATTFVVRQGPQRQAQSDSFDRRRDRLVLLFGRDRVFCDFCDTGRRVGLLKGSIST